MREITPDRFKNCKNYKKNLPKLGSKINLDSITIQNTNVD